MNPRWQVSFKGSILTEDALDELAHRGIALASHEARPLGDGTDLAATVWVRAVDEAEAISLVENAINLYGQFSDFTAEPVNYTMYLGFLESERQALEEVTHEVGLEDPRVSMVVISEPSKGSAELLLEIPAADQDAAVEQARTLYAELRQQAGLPPADPLYGFLGRAGHFPTIPMVAPLRHVELGKQAHKLFEDGIYNCAVIISQTACELLVFEGFTDLLEAQGESPSADFARLWFQKCRTTSMTDDRLRELWTLLTGDKIQEQHQWWPAYKDHVGRRNGAAHRGTEPTKAQAEESLKATDAFRTHVSLQIVKVLEEDKA
jgi:hypothetical protein